MHPKALVWCAATGRWTLVCWAFLLLLPACQKKEPPQETATPANAAEPAPVEVQPSVPEAATEEAADTDEQPIEAAATVDTAAEEKVVIEKAEDETSALVKSTGRAQKGQDIGMARDLAANRARLGITKLLKEKGYPVELPGYMQGVTIEKVYTKGRYVYAVASFLVPDPAKLNQGGKPSSNTPGDPQNP
jgi:hypothetical protein